MVHNIVVPHFDKDGEPVEIIQWYKRIGDKVQKGEILADVETATRSCDILAKESGVIEAIYIQEGKTTKIGSCIGMLKMTSDQSQQNEDESLKEKLKEEIRQELRAELERKEKVKVVDDFDQSEELGDLELKELEAHKDKNITVSFEAIVENANANDPTDVEEKITERESVDEIATVQKLSETIVVERPETDAENWNKVEAILTPEDDISKVDILRSKIINQRLETAHDAIISTAINEIDMSNIITLSEKFGKEFEKKHNIRLGYTPFIIKAVTHALNEFPVFNSFIQHDNVILRKNFDIAISTGGTDACVFPVIRNADKKSIAELEREMIVLSELRERNELTLEESSGGSFALINAGLYGSLLCSNMVITPNIASFSMHKVTKRAVVENDKIIVKPMMYVSLSFDNRIADIRDASLFMERVKLFAENIGFFILEI